MNIRHSTPNIQGGRRRSPKSRRSPLCQRAGRSLRSRVQGPKSKGPQTARDGGAPGVSTLAMRRPSLDCRHGGRRSGAFPGGDQVVFAKRSHLFAEFGCFPQTAAASCRVSADELMQVVDFPHPRGVRLVSGRSGVFPSIGGGFGLQRVKSSAWARLGSLKTAWARLRPLGLAWRGGAVKQFLRGNGDTVTQTTQSDGSAFAPAYVRLWRSKRKLWRDWVCETQTCEGRELRSKPGQRRTEGERKTAFGGCFLFYGERRPGRTREVGYWSGGAE
jgi:hypothetical protein